LLKYDIIIILEHACTLKADLCLDITFSNI